jgi:hypothetical protein
LLIVEGAHDLELQVRDDDLVAKQKPPKPPAHAVDLAVLHVDHPRISAQDWRSPLVLRVSQKVRYADGTASFTSSFRGEDLQPADTALVFRWKGLRQDFEQRIKTYQEHILTEHATLGLACVLLTRHTDFRISEVCRRGDRVDYWIGDSKKRKRFVLEVGGEQGGSLEGLANEKTTQLRGNPWHRAGFICVAVYEGAAARLWFCTHGSSS